MLNALSARQNQRLLQDAAELVGQSLPERDLAEATRLHRNTIQY